jgi:CPA1 family monovalent cation:H+ antiporter
VEIAASIATPYLAALAARALDLSVVAVIMAAALVISAVRIDPETGAPRTSAEARISAMAFWEEVSLILSAILFFLAGRALPEAVVALGDWPAWRLAGVAAALLAVALAVQLAASLVATVLPSTADELDAAGRRPLHRVAAAGVMAWASTRSVIGLVLALSIPATLPDGRPFAERDLLLVVAALVVVGSILVQGLTLRAVVRAAGLADVDDAKREKKAAERAIVETAPGGDDFPAARKALLDLRARNRIGDEVLREMLREIDLRQRATEESALPGAGPPNP